MIRIVKAVYMVASGRSGTPYIGVTSDLAQRAWQHWEGLVPGFTHKHNCQLLAWQEGHDEIGEARLQ